MGSPADHCVDTFWVRLLPYLRISPIHHEAKHQLLIRNNFEKRPRVEARLLVPPEWKTNSGFELLDLEANGEGKLILGCQTPEMPTNKRELMTAAVKVDGFSQGPVAEALVTVVSSHGSLDVEVASRSGQY